MSPQACSCDVCFVSEAGLCENCGGTVDLEDFEFVSGMIIEESAELRQYCQCNEVARKTDGKGTCLTCNNPMVC